MRACSSAAKERSATSDGGETLPNAAGNAIIKIIAW